MTKIKLEDVKLQFEEVNTRESYVLDKKTGLMLMFYPRFSEHRINLLRKELAEKISYCATHKIEFFTSDAEFYSYVHFLMVKYFTHFEEQIGDDFEEQIAQFQQLYEVGLIKLIVSEVLPQDEVQRVYDEVIDFAEMATKVIALEEKAHKEAGKLDL